MENIIIAFGSRTVSMRFSDYLARNGLPTTMINTPRELSIGCGLSVMVDERYLGQVKYLLGSFNGQESMLGIFAARKIGYKSNYVRI